MLPASKSFSTEASVVTRVSAAFKFASPTATAARASSAARWLPASAFTNRSARASVTRAASSKALAPATLLCASESAVATLTRSVGERMGRSWQSSWPRFTEVPGCGSEPETVAAIGAVTVRALPARTITSPPKLRVRGTDLRSTAMVTMPRRFSACSVSVMVLRSVSLMSVPTFAGLAALGASAAGSDAAAKANSNTGSGFMAWRNWRWRGASCPAGRAR